MVQEMSLEEYQDGCHGVPLDYQNRMILAYLILHVAPMPPTKFRFNRTCDPGGDVSRIPR